MKHRGVICDKCGVEVTLSKVRRERLGHIELGLPLLPRVVLQGPALAYRSLLDISLRDLESVLYFESYVVVDPAATRPSRNARSINGPKPVSASLDSQYRPPASRA